jgi:hypothetical protein
MAHDHWEEVARIDDVESEADDWESEDLWLAWAMMDMSCVACKRSFRNFDIPDIFVVLASMEHETDAMSN